MFLYVKNRFNPNPKYILKSEINNSNLTQNKFIKYIPVGNAPFLILPSSLEEFKKVHKKKFWYNLRRNIKMLKKELGEIQFEIIENDFLKLSKFLKKTFELFNERWKNEYTSSSWKTWKGFSPYFNAMIELAKEKKAFLAVLYSPTQNDLLLSFAYCLVENKTVYFYQHAAVRYDKIAKYSPGKILIWKLIEELIKRGYTKIDFMWGDSYYKREWGTQYDTVLLKIESNFKSILYLKYLLYKTKFYFQWHPFLRQVLKKIFYYYNKFFSKLYVDSK